ncbi:MAG: radical SAM protein [Candidatus Omnitrophota bacterium]
MKLVFLIYDNDASLNDFPLGIGYLISVLRQDGFNDADIHLLNMDVYHHSDEELFEYLKVNDFDAVCIGMIAGYWQYEQFKRMMAAVNRLKKRPKIILGGYMFTPEPEFFIKKFEADYIVLGEGERSFLALIRKLSDNKSCQDIPGLAYSFAGKIVTTERQKPIQDLDSVPFPAWDRFPIENYVAKIRIPVGRSQRSMPVITSRGCTHKCAFCYRMEPGYRMRSLDNVMEECKRLIKDYHINAICFRDELLMSSVRRASEFAERIIKEKLNIHFDIDGRLSVARLDLLKLLKRAGCVYINYGIESLDQDVLDKMNKMQTTDEIITGIEATIKSGINPGLNVIFGNVGDNRETAAKTVEFLRKYNTYGELRTLKPVTPYPGSPLYYLALKKGLIKDCEDFYENKHLNSDLFACNFTQLQEGELYDILYESNQILVKDHFQHVAKKHIEAHRKLYYEKDATFRGVRH